MRDVKQGRGSMVFSTGCIYEGFVHEGLVRHSCQIARSRFIMLLSNGFLLQPHGHGVLTCPNPDGSTFIIDSKWVGGVRDSKNNITFEDTDGSRSTLTVDDEVGIVSLWSLLVRSDPLSNAGRME